MAACQAVMDLFACDCCECAGMGRKARSLLTSFPPGKQAMGEVSLVRCVDGVRAEYCKKGGCDNATSERIISVMTNET